MANKNKKNRKQKKISIAQLLAQLPKFLYFWLVIAAAVGVIFQFSAETTGTFSGDDIYSVTFDHYPSLSEIDSELDELGIDATAVEVLDGNILRFRSDPEDADTHTSFVEKMSEQHDVLLAEAYHVAPLSPVSRYAQQALLALTALALGALVVLGVIYRKTISLAIKVFSVLFVPPVTVILVLAAIGIGLSFMGVIGYSKATFDLFVALVSSVVVISVYSASNSGLRKRLIGVLFDRN